MPPDDAPPAPAEAVETPAAAPEGTEAPAPSPETLQDQWRRIAGEGEEPPGEKPAEKKPEDEDTKPDGKRPKKPKVVEPEPAPPNELEALRQTAQRLGLVVEDGRVTTKERAQFREVQRNAAAQRAQLEQELLGKIEKATSEAQPRIERSEKLAAAVDAGDLEGVAGLLGFKPIPAAGDKPGLSSWDALIQHTIDIKADPNYQRLRRLEQEHEERAARDAQAAEEAQQRQQQQAQAQARATYMQNLSASMKTSSDPLLAAFHDEGAVVNAIFQIQAQEYQATGRQISPEQAMRMKLNGVNETPREWLERYHKRLHPVFGAAAPVTAGTEQKQAQPAQKPANPMAKPAPKTTTLPKPAAAARGKWQNDRAEKDDMIRRLEEAAAAEERELNGKRSRAV